MATKKPAKKASGKVASPSNQVTPFLMFSSGAQEAIKLYTSLFKDGKILAMGDMGPDPMGPGRLVSATFQVGGQTFLAMDGGPHFSFAQGLSLFISCKTQNEIDHFWEKLSKGGHKDRCGWLTDKWGVSWQVVPDTLGPMLSDATHGNSAAVMQAMLKMGKLDVAALKKAYAKK